MDKKRKRISAKKIEELKKLKADKINHPKMVTK